MAIQTVVTFPCGISANLSVDQICYELKGQELVSYFLSAQSPSFHSQQVSFAEFDFPIHGDAMVVGDGLQMLAQTVGTLNNPIDLGRCADNNDSYRVYATQDAKRYYNYLVIADNDQFTLFGFTSCFCFSGYFEFTDNKLNAYIDAENSTILAHAQANNCELESITVLQGADLNKLYDDFAQLIRCHHQPRLGVTQTAPIGWCSWYAYYASISEENIHKNVDVMSGQLDELQWVLLDDGYQAYMGDWLVPSEHFSGGVKKVIADIKAKGKKPAIWMAPFIAQVESAVFKEHPEWFLRHKNGDLLKAEDITYGGWRCTPWYILDCSQPEVCAHLTHVVRTMRQEWGIELFKLDANYWGILKGCRDENTMTGIQAYRLGMQAIAKGAGDAWLLGCNAAMWPSLGLVDAMRVSDDVERQGHRFEQIAKETFLRSWQHQRLWQIDPDCATFISIEGQATSAENYRFHRDVLLASGGLLLSGDPLYKLDDFALQSLSALISRQAITQDSAVFDDFSVTHGKLPLGEMGELHILFNYQGDTSKKIVLDGQGKGGWYDFWTGEKLLSEAGNRCQVALKEGLNSRALLFKAG
ncbi:glycoside hydrolase family 36 protein [Psychromonas hadalis]|uniref:glycoside hydrolase family 36 protein n=1 Tax=Psychromonas hadalis TaxID=211669 RepID=UPI0003B6D264|nr:alpha-galactosidase [Psychromonas hadalis]